MAEKLQPVRGTHDILPEGIAKPNEATFEKFQTVVMRAREMAALFGFKEMATPIFEATEVFARSMGETSDVVSKEMFTFQTKGDESVTLRPEFTAGIVRAFISNGMRQHLPLKLFSTGPVFRYERPQKGRQRQFHQVNYEWIGDASPEADVEIICLAGQLLYSLSGRQDCTLHINTLGDQESRIRYREALLNYLTPFSAELSEDSQRRLVTNPLRILDSKDENDKKIIQDAPKIFGSLSKESQKRFETIYAHLDAISYFKDMVKIEPNPSLVRGLDYYTDTVFEFMSETGELGAQNTVLAGGRYDGLVEYMGDKPTPAIGFAAGIERLLLLLQDKNLNWKQHKNIKIMVLAPENTDNQQYAAIHTIASALRVTLSNLLDKMHTKRQGTVETLWEGSLKKKKERAEKRQANYIMVPDLVQNICVFRNMELREEEQVPLDDFIDENKLAKLLNIELDSRLRGNDGQ